MKRLVTSQNLAFSQPISFYNRLKLKKWLIYTSLTLLLTSNLSAAFGATNHQTVHPALTRVNWFGNSMDLYRD